jgi:hypothetical protein
MTLLVFGAIFCTLIVIARELRLLRKQRETPPIAAERQAPEKYKPRIFTFWRSGWILRLVDLDEWVGTIVAVVIWFKFVLPVLPMQPWIRYPITIVGLILFGFCSIMVVELFDPLHGWMKKYDERVFNREFTPEEREYINDPHADSSKVVEMYRRKGL